MFNHIMVYLFSASAASVFSYQAFAITRAFADLFQ